MKTAFVNEAIALLKKANADLEPALPSGETARTLLDAYARAEKLAAFGVAALARKVDDASQLARIAGVSATTAKAVVLTGKTMSQSDELSAAPQQGDVSLDQATVIASADRVGSGGASEHVEPHVAHGPASKRQPQASLLEVSSGEDQARSPGRQAQTRGAVTLHVYAARLVQ